MLHQHNPSSRGVWHRPHPSSVHDAFTGFSAANHQSSIQSLRYQSSFDSRSPGTNFHVEAIPLGRGLACDAAGRAGSLRGPRRVFLCARIKNDAPRRAAPHAQKRFTRTFLIDSGERAVYKWGNRSQCAASVRVAAELVFFDKKLFSERPHECQIGSGEGIRTSVRVTFESHWLRSIRISVGVLSGFPAGCWLRPFETAIRFGHSVGRSQIERSPALTYSRGRPIFTHVRRVNSCRNTARLSLANFYFSSLTPPIYRRPVTNARL
jgi:hypothetical protein